MNEQMQGDVVVDDGEPPPSARENFLDSILAHVEPHEGATRYSYLSIGRHDARLTLAEGMIVARLGASGCKAYAQLSIESRCRLEDDIAREMVWLAGGDDSYDARVLCNHAPVLFEPLGHAMLLGNRDVYDDQWLDLEAHNIPTHEQKRLLVGGLAVLLWQLEQIG